jgi:hypothetical protein
MVAIALEGLAMICARRDQDAAAVSLWGFTDDLRQRAGMALSEERRRERDAGLARARDRLDEARFEQADVLGRAMSLDEVLPYAIEISAAPLAARAPGNIRTLDGAR